MRLFILLFVVFCNVGYGQINDAEAKILYQQAEDAYNSNDFLKALTLSKSLEEKMGKKLHKLTYILLKSYDKCIENNLVNKSYKDLDYHFTMASDFLSSVDKSSYPAEKYKEIEYINKKLLDLRAQYSAQKDRTPEKAVEYLNSFAQNYRASEFYRYRNNDGYERAYLYKDKAFYRENIDEYRHSSRGPAYKQFFDYYFSLEGSLLRIKGILREKDREGRDRFNQVHVIDYCIDLSYCNLDMSNDNFIIGPLVPGTRNQIAIKYGYHNKYDKKMNVTDDERKYLSQDKMFYIEGGFDIYQFWNPGWEGYKNEGYSLRIKEIFEYLINYFPKTKCPKPQVKSTF